MDMGNCLLHELSNAGLEEMKAIKNALLDCRW
jgi:hypothetical protein